MPAWQGCFLKVHACVRCIAQRSWNKDVKYCSSLQWNQRNNVAACFDGLSLAITNEELDSKAWLRGRIEVQNPGKMVTTCLFCPVRQSNPKGPDERSKTLRTNRLIYEEIAVTVTRKKQTKPDSLNELCFMTFIWKYTLSISSRIYNDCLLTSPLSLLSVLKPPPTSLCSSLLWSRSRWLGTVIDLSSTKGASSKEAWMETNSPESSKLFLGGHENINIWNQIAETETYVSVDYQRMKNLGRNIQKAPTM